MGLDMMIYKIKRFGTATLEDVEAVESMIDLREYNEKHPDDKCSFKEWCGREEPSEEIFKFYAPLRHIGKYNYMRIADEVAYWRKANAIHAWFVENVQDGEDDCCPHRELTQSDLIALRGLCKMVLDEPDSAPDLLPTQSGFFFGNTQYDRWYFDDIRLTIEQIDDILKNTDFNTEALYYVSSW